MKHATHWDYTFRVDCYTGHPALKIGQFEIWGGSCVMPAVKDADVYIGFDSQRTNQAPQPWQSTRQVTDAYYYIADMGVPHDYSEFIKLITWTHKQLMDGKKVHAGCLGGHGRTGLFLAALYTHITGDTDAIRYVRKNYCSSAVETSEQENWLYKHFGIDVPPVTQIYNNPGAIDCVLEYDNEGQDVTVIPYEPVTYAIANITRKDLDND